MAAKILSYWPDPLQPGNADGSSNYTQPNLPETIVYDTYTIRLDHAINSRHRVFGRASWYDRDSDYNDYFHNEATGATYQFISRAGVVDYVGALTSTMLLNLRYGYNRFIRASDMQPRSWGFDLTSLGFPKALNDAISSNDRRLPRIDLTGYQGTGQTGEVRPNDTHSFNATLNKTIGAHSFKGGMEFRAYREMDSFTSNDQSGRYVFETTYTRGPFDNSPAAPNS